MRFYQAVLLSVATLMCAAGSATAATRDLSKWFFEATAAQQSGTAAATIAPDFLGGRTMHDMQCSANGTPIGAGIWQLVKYDRVHGIGLAAASTDQCSVAVFRASPPGTSVPTADLSPLSTGRGVRIGSTFNAVVAAYGGKAAAHSGRFVVRYAATVHGTSASNKKVENPESLTFVIENGRVSAITVSVDLGNEF